MNCHAADVNLCAMQQEIMENDKNCRRNESKLIINYPIYY